MVDRPPACLQVTLDAIRACATPMALVSTATGALYCNVALRDGFGLPAELAVDCGDPQLPGVLHDTIVQWLKAPGEFDNVCRRDVLVDVARGEARAPRWFDIECSPVRIPTEDGRALMLLAHDVTARRVALLSNEALEERRRIASDTNGIVGMWDLSPATMHVALDPALARLFDVDAAQARAGMPLDRLLSSIHDDDRERLISHIHQTVKNEIAFKSRYRLRLSADSVLWVSLAGWPVHDYAGRLIRYTGVAVDVTEGALVIEALQANEARFRTLAESLPQIVWTSGADGVQNYVNQRWIEYTGLGRDAMGLMRVPGVVHPDDIAASHERWLRCMATGERYDTEYRIRHRSGNYRWFRVMAVPVRDESGRIVQWFGTATDVHGERMLQRQRELIAGELEHRIRNLFSLIQAVVVRAMMAQPACRQHVRTIANRIVELSRVYDLGPPSTAPGAKSLRRLILDMFAAYDEPSMPRLSFEGEDIEVTESAAMAISLIIHELTTNAIKYGALCEADGTIKVSLRRSAGRYLFTWKEYGCRQLASGGYKPGFGSRLLSTTVEEQLHGITTRHWESDGLRLTIDMPMEGLMPVLRHG